MQKESCDREELGGDLLLAFNHGARPPEYCFDEGSQNAREGYCSVPPFDQCPMFGRIALIGLERLFFVRALIWGLFPTYDKIWGMPHFVEFGELVLSQS